ncbi:hypothetical protein QC761_0072880 [Podospora bellae-mahoneyi]|uniref:Uncharacterized protein n=1 Tax=Podospora bellae-mahoneyi TaxID=2093777 RepID=A0ABR0FC33_9PEZI|nr:hypothetical protein QC761_0072880 [Podospora bellae-mahoneyi]
MPTPKNYRESRDHSRGGHVNSRGSNRRPQVLNAAVPSRRRVIPPIRSPRMRADLLAAAQEVQASAAEKVVMEAPVTETTAVQVQTDPGVASSTSGQNEASGSPSVSEPSDPDPASQQVQIWTGSLSEGVRQVTMLVTKSKPGRTDVSADQLKLYQESARAFF